jgi:D-alanine-D-alanine ligase
MKVAILTGWTGFEREVAIKSSEFIEENITYDYKKYMLPEELDTFLAEYESYDKVLPIFHGEYWEDWVIFGLLEALWVDYAFSRFDVHAICMNKKRTNIIAKSIWVKVPAEFMVDNLSDLVDINVSFPLIVKPNLWGSSFHTFKVNNKKELENAVRTIFRETNDKPLVQEFVSGIEYSTPVISINWDLKVLPTMKLELENGHEIFDYEAKYEGKSKEIFWENNPESERQMWEISLKLFEEFGCETLARFDFIENDKGIYFLEANTVPWMTEESILPKSWRFEWWKNSELIDIILEKKTNG